MTSSPTFNGKGQGVFKAYYWIGGVLRFATFDGATDSRLDALSAIRQTLSRAGPVDDTAIETLHGRPLTDAVFFGDWYDPASGNLIFDGTVKTADGLVLQRPTFRALDKVRTTSSGYNVAEIGKGGQFAYAFANSPHGLAARPRKIQERFDAVRAVLLPAGHDHLIHDWHSPDLDRVSAYFKAGKEWWGMLLFTVLVPDLRRLTVIVGSRLTNLPTTTNRGGNARRSPGRP